MTDAPSESVQPQPYDVLVVGGDAASLVAALDCARIGLRVVVMAIEASAHRPTVFSNRDGVVASLLTELGVAFVVDESPIAQCSIDGIPATPFAPQVRALVGWRGAWRVYRDRITPLLTIGTETNLGALVRRRLGTAAVTALVDPSLRELYGRSADALSVAAVVPGLNQAMTRAGSLTTGVIELLLADPRLSQALKVEGGIAHIEAALREKLAFFAADVCDVADVHLTLREAPPTSPDVPPGFLAVAVAVAVAAGQASTPVSVSVSPIDGATSSTSDSAPITVFAHALLVNPEVASAPEGAPTELAGEAGINARYPGLESAAPASRAASAAIRRSLLSNPKRLPLGPLSLEG